MRRRGLPARAPEVGLGLPGQGEVDQPLAVTDGLRELLQQLVDPGVSRRGESGDRPLQVRAVVIRGVQNGAIIAPEAPSTCTGTSRPVSSWKASRAWQISATGS